MQYTACLVGFLACLPLFGLGQNPDFCRTYDCPGYTVVGSTADYEIRRYDPATWAISQAPISKSRRSRSFMKLFGYITGNNVAADGSSMKIKMTVPVLKAKSASSMTMMFYINVPNAPTPTDSAVQLWNMPQKDFYVRVFYTGARPARGRHQLELDALKNALGSTALYNTTVSYTAGYYSPWYRGLRHNEVWLEKL